MSSSVVVEIGGRAALPVRALPFVTAWAESPDSLVAAMCRTPPTPPGGMVQKICIPTEDVLKSRALQAYLHHADGTYTLISHLQWQSVALELECLTKKLQADERPDANGENHARWRHLATLTLPIDGFVWLDEFEQWFAHTRPLEIPSIADLARWRIEQAALHETDDLALILKEGMSDFRRLGQIHLAPLIPTDLQGHLWQCVPTPVGIDRNVGGRPTLAPQIAALIGILQEFEKLGAIPDGPQALRGSVADLLDACQRLERASTGKATFFQIGENAFRKWMARTNYRFKPGRAPKGDHDYWTRFAPHIQVNNLRGLFFT